MHDMKAGWRKTGGKKAVRRLLHCLSQDAVTRHRFKAVSSSCDCEKKEKRGGRCERVLNPLVSQEIGHQGQGRVEVLSDNNSACHNFQMLTEDVRLLGLKQWSLLLKEQQAT